MANKLTPGSSVTVKQQLRSAGDKTWAGQFCGQTGTLGGKCGLYGGAYSVRFASGFTASFYPDELVNVVSTNHRT